MTETEKDILSLEKIQKRYILEIEEDIRSCGIERTATREKITAISNAIEAIREKANNPPLTEEQIRGMKTRWLWIKNERNPELDSYDKIIKSANGDIYFGYSGHSCKSLIADGYKFYIHEPR